MAKSLQNYNPINMKMYENPLFNEEVEISKTSSQESVYLPLGGGGSKHPHSKVSDLSVPGSSASTERDSVPVAGTSTKKDDKNPVPSTSCKDATNLQTANEQDFEQSNEMDETLIKDSRFKKFVRVLRRMSNSKFMLLIHLCLMAFFVSITYVGGSHMTKCPANPKAPRFTLLVGVMGTLNILFYFVTKATKLFYQPRITIISRYLENIFFTVTVVCAILETDSMTYLSPDSISKKEYCDKMFYCYMYFMNWALGVILFVFAVLKLILSPSFVRFGPGDDDEI